MLIQITPPAAPAVPVETLAEHLHLSTGAPELDESATLERLIAAATLAIERRISGALIMQTWRWRIGTWDCDPVLPLTPVAGIGSVGIVDTDGAVTPWTGWVLGHSAPQRLLTRRGETRPPIPRDGAAEIVFTAGYGVGWSDVPGDLRQAIVLLAAHYYEHREAAGEAMTSLPYGVGGLIAPYRPIRL